MSHVDDGELTAYADGAYPAGGEDAERIEAHLALCENCRNRLEQARALAGRATDILAAAAPIDITMPDFADVRAAAATVQRRRNAVPLTWAATVILALGLGWFGRGALFESEQQSLMRPTRSAQAPADMTAAAPERGVAVPELREQTATGAAARRSTPPQPIERQQAQAANAIDQATDVATTAAAAPPPSVAAAEQDFSREGGQAIVGRAAGLVAADIDYMTAAEAERRGVVLHAIPELEVLRVGVRENEVVVEQKLPDGKLVSITAAQLAQPQALADASAKRDAAAPAAPPTGARVRSEAALQKVALPVIEITRGNVRLRVSAALSQDSLRVLAAKLR